MIKKFDEVFVDKTRLGKKIPKEEYKKKGKYIIIDQGKDKIAGFTDNEDGIFTDVPTIIFGDHTRIIKYIDKPFFLGADGVKVLKSKINNANYKYLYYALKAAYIPNTGYNRHFKWLKKVSINYPSFEKQKRIVKLLDNLSEVKNKKNEELKLCDTLIKARFVEMFGDPICNSKNKSTTKFINVVKLQRGFDLPIRKRNTQGKIPVYGSNGVLGYHDEFKASSGIITGRSGTIGKVYYENNEFWPLNTALFSVKTYGNNIIYLKYLVSLFKLERFCNGAGVPTLNRNDVHKQKIIDIPIKEQNKFASFVQQVDKSKVVNASIMKYIISIRFYLYFKENKEGAR